MDIPYFRRCLLNSIPFVVSLTNGSAGPASHNQDIFSIPRPAPRSCDTDMPPQAYPCMGSVFAWQPVTDQNNNFNFVTSLSKCVLYGVCS